MILVFDTETTGFLRGTVWTAESQPHVVQFAGVVLDDELRRIHTFAQIVKPEGWEIPEQAADVHGITTEYAMKHGWPSSHVLRWFDDAFHECETIVGHNVDFDMGMMHVEHARRYGEPVNTSGKKIVCTMKSSTKHLKLPGPHGYKWPKLEELHRFLFNDSSIKGAHDALVDVNATVKCYDEMKKRGWM